MICYKGLPRIIEAHVYGANSAGQEFVRGYQIGGTSCTDEVGWKLLDIRKSKLSLSFLTSILPNQGNVRNDPAITTVYAQV
jgi:hypothetical protein